MNILKEALRELNEITGDEKYPDYVTGIFGAKHVYAAFNKPYKASDPLPFEAYPTNKARPNRTILFLNKEDAENFYRGGNPLPYGTQNEVAIRIDNGSKTPCYMLPYEIPKKAFTILPYLKARYQKYLDREEPVPNPFENGEAKKGLENDKKEFMDYIRTKYNTELVRNSFFPIKNSVIDRGFDISKSHINVGIYPKRYEIHVTLRAKNVSGLFNSKHIEIIKTANDKLWSRYFKVHDISSSIYKHLSDSEATLASFYVDNFRITLYRNGDCLYEYDKEVKASNYKTAGFEKNITKLPLTKQGIKEALQKTLDLIENYNEGDLNSEVHLTENDLFVGKYYDKKKVSDSVPLSEADKKTFTTGLLEKTHDELMTINENSPKEIRDFYLNKIRGKFGVEHRGMNQVGEDFGDTYVYFKTVVDVDLLKAFDYKLLKEDYGIHLLGALEKNQPIILPKELTRNKIEVSIGQNVKEVYFEEGSSLSNVTIKLYSNYAYLHIPKSFTGCLNLPEEYGGNRYTRIVLPFTSDTEGNLVSVCKIKKIDLIAAKRNAMCFLAEEN